MKIWFVSRQNYWGVDDPLCVEIALGGRDYANPDMLVEKYAGEGQEYADPREAAKSAVAIAESWRKDTTEKVRIDVGATGGNTMPFTDDMTDGEVLAWGAREYEKAEKCALCGDILPKNFYTLEVDPDEHYCSEYCAEKVYADFYAPEEENEN